MAQSLYRRYRPQRFGEVRGQDHVMAALRNSVRDDSVNHAYLFSGPRGTGKTSSARILAKALNCEAVVDGEPCGRCASCQSVEAGSSLDVLEMDAASHGGVDDVRDLVSRVALASPGRTKVYIVDEVHMLTTGASNALLKTLEEPPPHVVFVLATTDPQKVLATIRSRTQHFEFRLLGADLLAEHLTWVAADAGITLPEHAVSHAVRQGRGSARDALSALDAVIAAGAVDDENDDVVDRLFDAVCQRDPGAALVASARATAAGHDPRELADRLVARLRDAFLSLLAPELVELAVEQRSRVADQAATLGAAGVVRALDVLGEALQAMREAPDTRVVLDVALVRITRVELDPSPAALVERIERLERGARVAPGSAAPGATPGGASGAADDAPVVPSAPPGSGRAAARQAADAASRPALGAVTGRRPATAEPGPTPAEPAAAEPAAAETGPPAAPTAAPPAAPTSTPPAGGALPTRDELTMAWADDVLPSLRPLLRAMFSVGRFTSVTDAAELALPNEAHREKCLLRVPDVEAVLAAHFGRRVPLRLVVDRGQTASIDDRARPETATATRGPGPVADDDEQIDLADTTEAPPDPRSDLEQLVEHFPGAEIVERP